MTRMINVVAVEEEIGKDLVYKIRGLKITRVFWWNWASCREFPQERCGTIQGLNNILLGYRDWDDTHEYVKYGHVTSNPRLYVRGYQDSFFEFWGHNSSWLKKPDIQIKEVGDYLQVEQTYEDHLLENITEKIKKKGKIINGIKVNLGEMSQLKVVLYTTLFR